MGKQFQQNNNRRGGKPDRGSFKGRGGRSNDQGPPSFVIPYGSFVHRSENNFLVKCTDTSRVPKFNRGLYLESKAKIGSVDEILGPINSFFFSVKPADGVKPDSFKPGQTFYMSPEDLLPMERFTQKKQSGGPRQGGPRPQGQKFQQKGGFQKGNFGKGGKPAFKKPFGKGR